MLNVCPPYSPRHSMHWLKFIYSEPLGDYTVDDVWEYEKIRTEYQTISRVKDPECKVNSVVINYGQDEETTRNAMVKCVAPPKVLPTVQVRKSLIPIQLIQAWLWKYKNTDDLNRNDLTTIGYIIRGRKFEQCQKHINIGRARFETLEKLVEDALLLLEINK